MKAAQHHWLHTRKSLLQRMKARVHGQIGPTPKELKPYIEAYKGEFRGAWKNSTRIELLKAISEAQVVIGGDFHAFSQAQRTHLRLLRELQVQRPVVLGLECIESQYQGEIDKFLQGKITEKTFLKRVKWQEHWGFPWEHYRPLFKLAKRRKYRVIGLNRHFNHRSTITLKKRDAHSAKLIQKEIAQYPEALVYVIYGDLHLASPHLPKLLKKFNMVRVFQNSERLYFRLAQRGLENKVHILKSSGGRFCVLGSPPWVKWQSYHLFLDHNFDRTLDEDDDFDEPELSDHVQDIVDFICADLKIKVKGEDFSVYSAGHEGVWSQLRRSLSGQALQIAEDHIMQNESFYLAKSKLMYVSQPTINHGAHAVGQYLQAHLSGRKKNLWNVPKDFDALIWIEACGYLVSKMVNHRRKAESLERIRRRLEEVNPSHQAYELLLLVLEHQMRDLKGRQGDVDSAANFKPKRKAAYFSAAQILGNLLGEALYKNYRARGRDRRLILKYLKVDVQSPNFRKFYIKTLSQLHGSGVK